MSKVAKDAVLTLAAAVDEIYALAIIVKDLGEAGAGNEHEVLGYITVRLSEHEQQLRAASDVLWDFHKQTIEAAE